MLYKNLPFRHALVKIGVRFFLDWVAALRGLLSGDFGYFLVIFKAHFYFVLWCCLHKRKSIFPRVKTGPVNGWYQGSVVWEYFIKKKKTFSEIINSK